MPRQEFRSQVCDDAWKRAAGICECHRLADYGIVGFKAEGCGQKLGPVGNIYYEHIVADRAGGRPDLDNCAVLTRACWKMKTVLDQGVAQKTRDLERMARGVRTKERRGRPFPKRIDPWSHAR